MEIKGIFFFDPADRIYSVHFPGSPVVPGSVIVKAFLDAGETIGVKHPRVISDFRFRGFVTPGEHAFSIRFQADQFTCRLFQNREHSSRTLVTGTIKP